MTAGHQTQMNKSYSFVVEFVIHNFAIIGSVEDPIPSDVAQRARDLLATAQLEMQVHPTDSTEVDHIRGTIHSDGSLQDVWFQPGCSNISLEDAKRHGKEALMDKLDKLMGNR